MEIDKYKVKGEKFKNGMTAKFDNRRVTVIKEKDGWFIQFRTMNKNHEKICFDSKIIHGCQVSQIKLSQEAAEIMMIMLAKQINLKIGS